MKTTPFILPALYTAWACGPAAFGQTCAGWDGPLIPADTHRAAFVYDAARGFPTVISPLGYWDWDGTRWQSSEQNAGISVVQEAIYDANRNVAWLFNTNSPCDCWKTVRWDRTQFPMSIVSADPPFEIAAAAYDRVRGCPIVFGGRRGTLLWNDVWQFDGSSWTRVITTNRPGARWQTAMAYDTRRDATVMFGGNTSDTATWELHQTHWTRLNVSGPVPRSRHAMVYDARRGVTVLFGGYANGYLNDTFEWDGVRWTRRTASGPAARADHRMIYDEQREVVLLFGGEGRPDPLRPGMPIRDLWQWDGASWTKLWEGLPVNPLLSGVYGAAYDAARARTVYSGLDIAGTWEWDGTSCTRVGPYPDPAASHLDFDSRRRTVVAVESGRVWEWDGLSWSSRSIPGPQPAVSLVAYDPARDLLVGVGPDGTWELGSEWTYVSPDRGPSGSWLQGTYDAGRERCILYAWPNGSAEWDGSHWSAQVQLFLGAQLGLTYDETIARTLLFANIGAFAWTGTAWEPFNVPPIDAASPHSFRATYDALRDTTVLFDDDTIWELSYGAFHVTEPPRNVIVASGHDAILEVRTVPQRPVQYWWRHNGERLPDPSSALVGVRSRVLTIPRASALDQGLYDVELQYWVQEGGSCQLATSAAAQLTVVPRGDCNCDGAVDNSDIDAFVLALLSEQSYAVAYPGCPRSTGDLNLDDSVDNSDIDLFVECLVDGNCPS